MIDLHLHTTASDGLLSPKEMVEKAMGLGLEIIAITDHDTTAGISEAIRHAQNLLVVPGIELSAELDGQEVHVLGYKIDTDSVELQQILEKLRKARIDRIKKITDLLQENNLDITWDEVLAAAGDASSIGRPHVARILVKKGYVPSVKDAFKKWLGPGCPAWVQRYKLTPQEAVQAIHDAGGLAFLAHPGLLRDGLEMAQSLLPGLDGIEVYHSEHSPEGTNAYRDFALKNNLLVSGGSDCHGAVPLMGTVKMDFSLLMRWLKA